MPATWSQLNRHWRATAAKLATFSQSITIASNAISHGHPSASSMPTNRSISVLVLATRRLRRLPPGSSYSIWWVNFAMSIPTRTTRGTW